MEGIPPRRFHACARLFPLEAPSGEGEAVAGVDTPQTSKSSIFWPSPSLKSPFPSQTPNSGLFQGSVRPLGQMGGHQKLTHPLIRGGGAR